MGGARTESRKKIPPGQPREGARERGCVCKGRPLGPAQAGSQAQLFVSGLPRYHGSAGGRRSQQIAGREEGRRESLCTPGWQDCLFLAKNYF